ncbi:MAG: hypothetical protein ACYC6M_05655 [Terriglobales bacterium]
MMQKGHTLTNILIAACNFVAGTASLQKDRVKRLGERELLSTDDFCSRFYSGEDLPRERILDVLKDLSEALEIPAGKLRPSDRFLVELAPLKSTWGPVDDTDFSVMVLTNLLERKYGVRIEMKTIKTIDDYIRAACSLPSNPSAKPIAKG